MCVCVWKSARTCTRASSRRYRGDSVVSERDGIRELSPCSRRPSSTSSSLAIIISGRRDPSIRDPGLRSPRENSIMRERSSVVVVSCSP